MSAKCQKQTSRGVLVRTAWALVGSFAAFAKAMQSGQLSAAVSALKEKGVLSGKRIERSEIGSPGEFDHLSDDELERALHDRFERLFGAPLAIGSDHD